MTVHPSTKLLMPGYAVTVLAAIAIAVYNAKLPAGEAPQHWLYIVPAAILLWTAIRHMSRLFVRLQLEDFRLRFESGLVSKSTRIMELRKVQDIRVNQSLIQRMIGTGDLSIETAGESSRLEMLDIDNPQAVADKILAAAHQHYKSDQAAAGPSI
jgi:uncharacterized membrane protein YdbT with pleckstrin-like domain